MLDIVIAILNVEDKTITTWIIWQSQRDGAVSPVHSAVADCRYLKHLSYSEEQIPQHTADLEMEKLRGKSNQNILYLRSDVYTPYLTEKWIQGSYIQIKGGNI